MTVQVDRRSGHRLRFCWPLWFGYEENGEFRRAQIADLGRETVAFTIDCNDAPQWGDRVLTRFSYPMQDTLTFAMHHHLNWSEVIRVDHSDHGRCRVALRLDTPLRHWSEQPSMLDQTVLAV